MSIGACVKVRDGVVLGTDSMTQIWAVDPKGTRVAIKNFRNARKLFQIGDLPIGIVTYGVGNLGNRSTQGLIFEFSSGYEGDPNVESVARSLFDHFKEPFESIYDTSDSMQTGLGFFVAGYSPDQPLSEEYEFLLPRDQGVKTVRPMDQVGASWRGVELPFTRLHRGFDPRLLEDLVSKGVSRTLIDEATTKYKMPVVYDGMPVQDAVNLVVFILQTTIGVAAFEPGFSSCGGPLQVAVVQRSEEFKWIQEPSLGIQSTF